MVRGELGHDLVHAPCFEQADSRYGHLGQPLRGVQAPSSAGRLKFSGARAERMPDGGQRDRVTDDAADQGEWLLNQVPISSPATPTMA